MSLSQLTALSADELAVFSTAELLYLNVTTANIAALKTTSLSTAQLNALRAGRISPLALDLDGDGIETLSIDEGVNFDLLANGNMLRTGWIAPDDGLLAMDRNRDGVISSGAELFGEATAGLAPNAHGFDALAKLDSNHDGIINWQDVAFDQLLVWRDLNRDGHSDAGELFKLGDVGIISLSLEHRLGTEVQSGNWLGLLGNYTSESGQTQALVDVWLQVRELDELERKRASLALGVPPIPSGTDGGD